MMLRTHSTIMRECRRNPVVLNSRYILKNTDVHVPVVFLLVRECVVKESGDSILCGFTP